MQGRHLADWSLWAQRTQHLDTSCKNWQTLSPLYSSIHIQNIGKYYKKDTNLVNQEVDFVPHYLALVFCFFFWFFFFSFIGWWFQTSLLNLPMVFMVTMCFTVLTHSGSSSLPFAAKLENNRCYKSTWEMYWVQTRYLTQIWKASMQTERAIAPKQPWLIACFTEMQNSAFGSCGMHSVYNNLRCPLQ